MSEWRYEEEYLTDEIEGLDCHIWIERRPNYCDRGNFLAKIELLPHAQRQLNLDNQDGWPRYYMDLGRAKAEIEDWMKKRKQWA